MPARVFLPLSLAWLIAAPLAAAEPKPFEIHVVDEATGRGVPLVELTTTNHQTFVTDNAGRIAFSEPELMDREVFFSVFSHGYEPKKDGFGFAGLRATPAAGRKVQYKLKRLNVAERLYRITGEGQYRDSQRLGYELPYDARLKSGVVGQDSVQGVTYRDRLYWFWGDTSIAKYPLGNFRTTGATSKLPISGGLDPQVGVDLTYFADAPDMTRKMLDLPEKDGVVWVDALVVVPDKSGRERMLVRYERRQGLAKRLAQGYAVWNDDKNVFEHAGDLPREDSWRMLVGHPVRHKDATGDYVYASNPFANVRVPATLEAILDPAHYEAWTPADATGKLRRNAEGQLAFAWEKDAAAAWSSAEEAKQRTRGAIQADEAIYHPVNVDTGAPVKLHGGSVRWNAHRRRWVLIAVAQGETSSYLGEVYYSEAKAITGPWRKAKKIVTHDRYSFYNPVHHDFFDADNGRTIYFEGTYSFTFSRPNQPTPRYDYNQVMYRLDLEDARLHGVREE